MKKIKEHLSSIRNTRINNKDLQLKVLLSHVINLDDVIYGKNTTMSFSLFIYLFNTFLLNFASNLAFWHFLQGTLDYIYFINIFVWTDYFPRWWLRSEDERAPKLFGVLGRRAEERERHPG